MPRLTPEYLQQSYYLALPYLAVPCLPYLNSSTDPEPKLLLQSEHRHRPLISAYAPPLSAAAAAVVRHPEPLPAPPIPNTFNSLTQSSHRYPTIKMASHEQEDTMPEETQGYKLSQPKQSLAEYQKMGES